MYFILPLSLAYGLPEIAEYGMIIKKPKGKTK